MEKTYYISLSQNVFFGITVLVIGPHVPMCLGYASHYPNTWRSPKHIRFKRLKEYKFVFL